MELLLACHCIEDAPYKYGFCVSIAFRFYFLFPPPAHLLLFQFTFLFFAFRIYLGNGKQFPFRVACLWPKTNWDGEKRWRKCHSSFRPLRRRKECWRKGKHFLLRRRSHQKCKYIIAKDHDLSKFFPSSVDNVGTAGETARLGLSGIWVGFSGLLKWSANELNITQPSHSKVYALQALRLIAIPPAPVPVPRPFATRLIRFLCPCRMKLRFTFQLQPRTRGAWRNLTCLRTKYTTKNRWISIYRTWGGPFLPEVLRKGRTIPFNLIDKFTFN